MNSRIGAFLIDCAAEILKSIGCVENFTHVEYTGNVDAQTFFLVNVCKYKCLGIH